MEVAFRQRCAPINEQRNLVPPFPPQLEAIALLPREVAPLGMHSQTLMIWMPFVLVLLC